MKISNQNGITLVSLVVSIIIMLILASVTISTSFTAYETTKAEKFKAEMSVIESAIADFNANYSVWKLEKEDEYKDLLNKKHILEEQIAAMEANQSDHNNYYKLQKIKDEYEEYKDLEELQSDGSLPVSGNVTYAYLKSLGWLSDKNELNSFKELKEFSYKNSEEWNQFFDKYYPEEVEYLKEVNISIKESSFDSYEAYLNFLLYMSSPYFNFYKFDSDDLEKFLGIKDIDLTVYIDFDSNIVLSAKSITVDGEKVCSLRQLESGTTLYHGRVGYMNYQGDYSSATSFAKIRIDEIANYGTSKKIKLTLNTNDIEKSRDFEEYKISKAYYKSQMKSHWTEVDTLRDCEYSEDGKSVTFTVFESGNYEFRIVDTVGAYTEKMEQYTKFNIITKSADENDDYETIESGGYKIILCNPPIVNSNMVPIKWMYEDSTRRTGYWVICSTLDPEWYNYSENKKMWANIMFKGDSNFEDNESFDIGMKVPESKVGSMFVWIPRYAITSNKTSLDYKIQFLRDASNTTTFGTASNIDGLEVPIAFVNNNSKKGSWDSELRGLWIAKYDTGIETLDKQKYYNNNKMIDTDMNTDYNNIYKYDQNFKAVSKPYHFPWTTISYTNAFSQALMFYNSANKVQLSYPNPYENYVDISADTDINSHMMKESEYMVLRNITLDGKFGTGYDDTNKLKLLSNNSNRYTGGSDGKNGFSTINNFEKQSSNGNITGVFDISGTIPVMLSSVVYKFNFVDSAISSQNNFRSYLLHNYYGENIIPYYKDNEDKNLVPEKYKQNDEKFKNKYLSMKYCGKEEYGYSSIGTAEYNDLSIQMDRFSLEDSININSNVSAMKSLNQRISSSYGYRIVVANSPAGNINDFLYDSNTRIAKETEPGFFVTDEDGNLIRTDGKFEDSNGNPTFYSWEELVKSNDSYNDPHITMNNEGNITSVSYKLKNLTGILVLSDTVNGININAFKDWKKLIKIDMSESSVKSIGNLAFSGCTELQEVIFPKEENGNIGTLESIGMKSFENCKSLVNITFPASLKKIGADIYDLSTEFNDGKFKQSNNGTYEIGAGYSFSGCERLQSVTIPRTLLMIGSYSFKDCTSLIELNIEEGRANELLIGVEAFANTAISELNFPDSTRSIILYKAFANCNNLKTVTGLYAGISRIDYGVFYNCSMLTDVNLFIDPALIKYGKFSNEYAYKNEINGLFEQCISIKEINMRNFIFESSESGETGPNLCKGCSNLEKITLPGIERY